MVQRKAQPEWLKDIAATTETRAQSLAFSILQAFPFLACPHCQIRPEPDAEGLYCSSCRLRFPLNGIIPVMLPRHVSFNEGAAKQVKQSAPGFFRRHLTTGVLRVDTHAKLTACCQGPILNIGGGPKRDRSEYINLNLAAMENVDIVGDAAALPCLSNSVSGVVCNAVLEHVPDPWRVVREIDRILQPGGHVLIEVPFLQHYHPSPEDFHRFTIEGTRALCRRFEELEIGMAVGPTVTFIEMVESFLIMLFGHRNLMKGITRVALWPLRFVDPMLLKLPLAHTLASGFYFIGRKPTHSG